MRLDHQARTEDIRWMARTGEGVEGAARRLGIGVAALEKYCRDNDLRAEWRALVVNGPRDWNRHDRRNQWSAA